MLPRHYFPDSVYQTTKRGKKVTDTSWHRLADFTLQNQLGDTVGWEDLQDKIIVADFFFTRCPTICPGMTQNMKRFEELSQLQRDIILLTMEKNPNRRSFFEGKLVVMAVSFLLAILGVFLLLTLLKKNKS